MSTVETESAASLVVDEEPPPASLVTNSVIPLVLPRFSAEPPTAQPNFELSYSEPSIRHQFLQAARRRGSNPRTRAFRRRFFPTITDKDWNDWRWQSRHRARTLEHLEKFLVLSDSERQAIVQGGSMLPVGITPYYLSLVSRDDANEALRRTVIPALDEFKRTRGEADDPLGEDGHSPVPGLVHRYPDRVLFLALDFCSTYCRYCTRSRVVGHGELMPNEARLQQSID